MGGVERDMGDALEDPGGGDGSVAGSRHGGPDGGEHERQEQHTDVAGEVLVVVAACGGDPAAAGGEVVEERAGEESGLYPDGRHHGGDHDQRPVRSGPHGC